MWTFWASLKHFWQIHLTVALCTAVATGVLGGALLVGDSVRGSLKAVTLERLGTIEHAMLADLFFAPELINRPNMVPAVLLNGTVVVPEMQTRAAKVNIHGINQDFFQLWENPHTPNLTHTSGQPFPGIAINTALQTELNVQVGDALLVYFPQSVGISPEFLLGRRETSEVIQTLRLIVSDIVPTQNAGRFSLRAHQSLPLNAFIALPVLQNALGQTGKVNALFTSEPEAFSPDAFALTLDVLGLKIHEHENHFDLQSQHYLIKPQLSDIALLIAAENGIPTLPTLTYLANTITANGKTLPYSTILGMLPAEHDPVGLRVKSNLFTPERSEKEYLSRNFFTLDDNEIILNTWAATDLGVEVDDSVEISYYRTGAAEQYTTQTALFRLKAITPIHGLAADTSLIPEFPGIHATTDMSNWDAPFPIDYTLIRERDEAYWDEYRATPKAFISLKTAQRLWKNRFGNLTGIRMQPAPNLECHATRELFETAFLKKIQPEQIGFQFLAPRAAGLQASEGTTDFGMLFSSLSILIILSVASLIRMLFQIGVEQRSREIGILRALGYPLAKIRSRFLIETGIIAGLGSLLGCAFAIAYTQLMLYGLRTWWLPAIGTPFVTFHMQGSTLFTGISIALAVVLFTIYQTVQKLGNSQTASLLAGGTDFADRSHKPKSQNVKLPSRSRIIIMGLVIGMIGVAIGFGIGFFTNLGTSLLEHPFFQLLAYTSSVITLGWGAFGRWLSSQKVAKRFSRLRFTLKNAARQPGHSKGCVVMVSLACCIIVAVGVNRQDAPPETEYTFVAESDSPLHHSLNTSAGRFELGFSERDAQLLSNSEVIPFRVLPGEDVSCLNLYQPQKPQILGVSARALEKSAWPRSSHWHELKKEGDRVYALADENSIRWVLHHNPEEPLLIEDEFGNPLGLHLHTIQNSLFQSQLIISESHFIRLFPSQSGYRYFLIKTPPEFRKETAAILEKTLRDYGFDVTSASARLANYQGVTNAYISTFQSLGGFGIILGTFGLALVLFRNVIERRGELATLRAFGFRRQLLSRMLFVESSFLLVVGMLIGTLAGLVSVLGTQGYFPAFPWLSLIITLLLILGFGIIANAVAVALALRSPLLATLKKDL